jgi:hypothetical protein
MAQVAGAYYDHDYNAPRAGTAHGAAGEETEFRGE